MNTLRAKVLAAFVAEIIFTLGVLTVRDFVSAVEFRLDRIEQYLTHQSIPRAVPQSATPQRWKV